MMRLLNACMALSALTISLVVPLAMSASGQEREVETLICPRVDEPGTGLEVTLNFADRTARIRPFGVNLPASEWPLAWNGTYYRMERETGAADRRRAVRITINRITGEAVLAPADARDPSRFMAEAILMTCNPAGRRSR